MKRTPIWLLPIGWNPNEVEGREAFEAGEDVDFHPYGDSAAAKDFQRGWRQAEARSKEQQK